MAINWVHTFKDEQNLNLHAISSSRVRLCNHVVSKKKINVCLNKHLFHIEYFI
jgi:hypothetical protein